MSTVSNATQPAHNVPDAVARVAAASAALQGKFEGSPDNPKYTQYQFYTTGRVGQSMLSFLAADLDRTLYAFSGLIWEVHYQPTERVGNNMAQFATESLSATVSKNTPIVIHGTVPFLGSPCVGEMEISCRASDPHCDCTLCCLYFDILGS